eukprot:1136526-Pelagomonas_calceolata.AAC.3
MQQGSSFFHPIIPVAAVYIACMGNGGEAKVPRKGGEQQLRYNTCDKLIINAVDTTDQRPREHISNNHLKGGGLFVRSLLDIHTQSPSRFIPHF